jgi:hypothetical protein
MFQMEAGAQAQVVFERLAAELREVAKPVLAVLRKAYAASAGFGMGAAMVQLLDAIQIPSLIANEPPLINGFRATDEGGNTINLQSAWRDDPSAAAIASALQPLHDIRCRVVTVRREPLSKVRAAEITAQLTAVLAAGIAAQPWVKRA